MIITDEMRERFKRQGYLVIKEAVPEEYCDRVVDATWEFLGHNPDEPDTWYEPPEGMSEYFSGGANGMVEMYHHQSMWDTRQHPLVYQAFAEILGEEALWVSIDRVNMTPPRREEFSELDNEFIHWDFDLSKVPDPRPVPNGVQGVLYLEDTNSDQGGFQCVPSIYENIDEYLKNIPADADPYSPQEVVPDFDDHEIVKPEGEKGDLLIWDRLLAHGNGRNLADKPRLAQYILMEPATWGDVAERERRVESFQSQMVPAIEDGYQFPGDPREYEVEAFERPTLTPLGRKLLGVDPWSGWLSEN